MPPLFVLVGPSGVGKTSILHRLLAMPELHLSRVVTTTTRPPRASEQDGVEFWFVTPDTFQQKEAQGEFLETTKTLDRSYGTSRAEMEQKQAEQRPLLITLDMAGAIAIRSQIPNTHVFFISAPREQLIKRLQQRQGSPDEIAARIQRLDEELSSKKDADVIIENPDGALDQTVEQVAELIRTRYHHK